MRISSIKVPDKVPFHEFKAKIKGAYFGCVKVLIEYLNRFVPSTMDELPMEQSRT